jgi:hypothetical protein
LVVPVTMVGLLAPATGPAPRMARTAVPTIALEMVVPFMSLVPLP